MKKFHHIKVNASNNGALLNKAIQIAQLKNDAGLSRKLNIAPTVISKIRHGCIPVGATFAICLHEETGMSIGEMKRILVGSGK